MNRNIKTTVQQTKMRAQLLREIELLKDRKGFLRAGVPNFNRLFGRDAIIAAWQLLNWNPGISKATLQVLSELQGRVNDAEKEEELGKIIHETHFELSWHPKGYFPFPYYGTVDSTPLFLILFSLYFQKTGDWKFVENHWENILIALHWMEQTSNEDNGYFLEYERKNPKGLYHQGWKDSFTDSDHLNIEAPVAIVEAQGYQYAALLGSADLAERKHDLALSAKLKTRAANLKQEFNKKFWMKDKQFFALALDGSQKQRKAITSNPGHCLFTGIVEEKYEKKVVERLFQKDMWTPYGIRTHSGKEPDFNAKNSHLGGVWPHDNWVIAQGCKALGFKEEYRAIKEALFSVWSEMGFIPEYYGVVEGTLVPDPGADYPQAWATCALFDFLKETK